jgi:hypothetical protein
MLLRKWGIGVSKRLLPLTAQVNGMAGERAAYYGGAKSIPQCGRCSTFSLTLLLVEFPQMPQVCDPDHLVPNRSLQDFGQVANRIFPGEDEHLCRDGVCLVLVGQIAGI